MIAKSVLEPDCLELVAILAISTAESKLSELNRYFSKLNTSNYDFEVYLRQKV
jgi:hypothetical protein